MAEKALSEAFGARWRDVLENLDDGVIVMDRDRQLRFANRLAHRILGYRNGETVDGRCRHNTRGEDCESACPLTFALEHGRSAVRDFETVYRNRDGDPVPLRVTVIPLLDADGAFAGAVEVFKVRDPDPGFYLAGPSDRTASLKKRLFTISEGTGDLILVGDRTACRDVARAFNRFCGWTDENFIVWSTGDQISLSLPFGTLYAENADGEALLANDPPEGWRRVVGFAAGWKASASLPASSEIVRLCGADMSDEDLSRQLVAWIERLKPELEIEGTALLRLVELTRERGFDGVVDTLTAAVAAAGGVLSADSLPSPPPHEVFFDQVFDADDPLGTMERKILTEVLDRCEWRMQEAADRLGMSRVTLWRKIKDHGIERPGADS